MPIISFFMLAFIISFLLKKKNRERREICKEFHWFLSFDDVTSCNRNLHQGTIHLYDYTSEGRAVEGG